MDQATVLIVDSDLGFIFWLGEIFSETGSHVVPALDCEWAVSIVNSLKLQIDVVVVNCQLAGIGEMMDALSAPGQTLKIVEISEETGAGEAAAADAFLTRPSAWEQVSRDEWLERVQEILRDVH